MKRLLLASALVMACSLSASAGTGRLNCQVISADPKVREMRVECPEKAIYSKLRVAWLLTGEFDNAVSVGTVCKLQADGKNIWIEFRDTHGNTQHHKFDLRMISVSEDK